MKIYTSMMQGGSIPPNPKDGVIPIPCPPPLDVHERDIRCGEAGAVHFIPILVELASGRHGRAAAVASGGASGAAAGMEEQQCAAA